MPPRKASSSRQRINSIPLPAEWPSVTDGKGLEEAQWTACKEMLQGVYKAKDGNRKISDIFRELPDEEQYADYYQAIPEPECLDNIASTLGAQGYASSAAFFKQLHLVFLNAKHYNEDESLIWLDAKRLENQIHQQWAAYTETGVFANADPYHNSPVKPGRKGKRGASVRPSKSATPLPDTTVKAATPAPRKATSPLKDTKPSTQAPVTLVAAHPSILSPSPAPVPSPTPVVSATMPRTRTPLTQTQSLPIVEPVPSPSENLQRQAQIASDERFVQSFVSTLPRWPGPQLSLPGETAPGGISGSGWFGQGTSDHTEEPTSYANRIRAVINAIAGYKDHSGQRLAEMLEQLPISTDIPYLSFQAALSFASITAAAQASRYPSLPDFDSDMTRLFEKGRRWYADGSEEYGKVLALQRLYNALTGPYPLSLPSSGIPEPSSTLYASLPAGPGNARSLHETTQELKAGAAEDEVGYGVTTFRVGSKDRIFTEEARHKGVAYRVGDFVHLINPDDATRPIVGQIFKTFVPTKGSRIHHATVCWYYRPEQTVHTADRLIFEREVFKTGHFCDHPVEDILEKISVQFYVKYIRGRPRAGEYYPGWPIYVCHSRFNDREHLMVRIKNWQSCIPDELRQTDFMSIVPFQRIIELPTHRSPFLRGITGPGFLGEPKTSAADDEDEEEDERPKRRERTKREVAAPPATLQTAIQSPSHIPLVAVPTPPQMPVAPVAPSRPIPTFHPVGPSFPERTIAAIMGGSQAMDQAAVKELLPHDTARMFERDARGQVLWFSGPPLPPGSIKIHEQPAHSLEYLTYLTKRKMGTREEGPLKRGRWALDRHEQLSDGDVVVDSERDDEMSRAWWAQSQSSEQVMIGLKALIDSVI